MCWFLSEITSYIGCNGGIIDHNRSACTDCESMYDDQYDVKGFD